LDNCCFNRPFDNQDQPRTHLEAEAKLHIQNQINNGIYELVWSYILEYENARNPYEDRHANTLEWKNVATIKIVEDEEIVTLAENLILLKQLHFPSLRRPDSCRFSGLEVGCAWMRSHSDRIS
jgi:hypothetical protein